jgi:hypothetical protein
MGYSVPGEEGTHSDRLLATAEAHLVRTALDGALHTVRFAIPSPGWELPLISAESLAKLTAMTSRSLWR